MGTLPTKMDLNSPLGGTTSKMMTPQLPWSPWLNVTMMKLQLMGLMTFAAAAQQLYVGYMAAGTHKGKTKGFKGKNKGKHIFRTQLSESVWQS